MQLFLLQRQTSGVPGHSGAFVSSEAGSTCFKVTLNCLGACICAVCVSQEWGSPTASRSHSVL